MSRNLHQEVTNRIIEQLEAGVAPWRKPWSSYGNTYGARQSFGSVWPKNFKTNRPYSGVNVLLLWITAQSNGYTDNRWLTFNQCKELGGHVRKGEKSTMIVYAGRIEVPVDGKKDGKKKPAPKGGKKGGKKDEKKPETKFIPILKSFNVFNVAQCDGLKTEAVEEKPAKPLTVRERHEAAEVFIKNTGASIRFGGNKACYIPALDIIELPKFEQFHKTPAFYCTAFHELGHWTGHKTRLNRDFSGRFGDNAYAAEELVAELTAAFCCAQFGLDNDTLENSAAYLDHWIKVLKESPYILTSAASKASKATDLLNGVKTAEEEHAANEKEAA